MAAPVLLVERADRVAAVTLNRPEARNALSAELISALRAAMRELEADEGVDVVILTGTDPAFCAGLDLKELGSSGANLSASSADGVTPPWFPWPPLSKPVIGAVNGFAVTGGLELALRAGLVTQVVPHEELLPAARSVAASIVGNDQAAVRTLLRSYRDIERALTGAGHEVEARTSKEWMAGFDPAEVESRRRGVLERGVPSQPI